MRYIIVALLLFVSSVCFAHPNSADNRAMGNILSQDIDNPAVSAFNKDFFHFTFLSVDVRLSMSQAIKTYNWTKDFIDFKDGLDNITDVFVKRDKIVDILSRAPQGVSLLPRIDLLSFIIGSEASGKFHFGLYGSGYTAIKLAVPDLNNITVNGTSIDMGKPIDLVSFMGIGDAGLRTGYGKSFNLPGGHRISGGIVNRTYYRWNVPMKSFHLNRNINGMNDITVPDISYMNGIGTAFDLSVAFNLEDNLVNPIFIGSVENVFSKTWYDSGSERDLVAGSVGVLIRPLHRIKNENLGIEADFKIYEDGVGACMGMYYYLGNRWINFVPKVGGIIADRGPFGEKRNVLTMGFSTMLGVVAISPTFEYLGGGEYDVGFRFALGN